MPWTARAVAGSWPFTPEPWRIPERDARIARREEQAMTDVARREAPPGGRRRFSVAGPLVHRR